MSNSSFEPKDPPFMSERKLKRLFLTMDKEDIGYIEYYKLQSMLKSRDSRSSPPSSLPSSTSSGHESHTGTGKLAKMTKERRMRQYLIEDLANYCAEHKLDRISYQEFCQFIRKREKALWKLFCEVDSSKNGVLGKREIQQALHKAGAVVSEEELKAFMFHVDSDKDGVIKFEEWSEFLLFSPKKTTIRNIYSFYQNIIHQSDSGDQLLLPESSRSTLVTFKYLIAGGIAGAISRTSTAPLDRIRVLLMCKTGNAANASTANSWKGILNDARKLLHEIYADGGITAFWRGNGVNIIKIIPESAIRFYVFESCKRFLKSMRMENGQPQTRQHLHGDKSSFVIQSSSVTTTERMISGGIAGFTSQFFIYPLETIKTRMMANLQTAGVNSHRVSAIKIAKTMLQTEGYRAFFRGIGPSLLGIIPYASIDLTAYETLKQAYHSYFSEKRKPSTAVHLICGATAGALSASVVYPLGLIRTRLQAQGTSSHQHRYPRGAIDVITKTYQQESFRGFYKGLAPTLVKVIPAVSISYLCYEEAKVRLGIA